MLLLTPYNPDWPIYFQEEAKLIKKMLGDNCVNCHHIGSTSIPGLIAKPRLDILLVIKNRETVIEALKSISYDYKGEINIPFQMYLKKDINNDLGVNLHCFEEGNSEIDLNLTFRNFVRNHPNARDEYASLKKRLDAIPKAEIKENSTLMNYTLGKQPFIQSILKQAGFDKLCIHFCTHKDEWAHYHTLRQELFKPLNIVYDSKHPTLSDPNHYHFILYKGTRMIGAAQIELIESMAILRSLIIDSASQHKGFGTYFIKQLEDWCLRIQNKSEIKVHAAVNAINFYSNNGYTKTDFNDVSIDPNAVPMGKTIRKFENV